MKLSRPMIGVAIAALLVAGPSAAFAQEDTDLTVDQAKAEIAAFTCEGGGASEASGRLWDQYMELADRLPDDVSSGDRGAVSDAFFAKIKALNFCAEIGTTPPPEVVEEIEAAEQSTENAEGDDYGQVGEGEVPGGGVETGGA